MPQCSSRKREGWIKDLGDQSCRSLTAALPPIFKKLEEDGGKEGRRHYVFHVLHHHTYLTEGMHISLQFTFGNVYGETSIS